MSSLQTSIVHALERAALRFSFLGIPNHIYKPHGCDPRIDPTLEGGLVLSSPGPSIQLNC